MLDYAKRPAGPDAAPVGALRAGRADADDGPHRGDAARPRRLRGGAAQPRQGLRQRPGLEPAGRPVLHPRADAARLRGAPPAPADHAAGLHPRPARGRTPSGMHPAIEAGLAGWPDRDGAAFQAYPALKQLTLDIAADIFMGGAEDTTREQMDEVNRAFVDLRAGRRRDRARQRARSPGGVARTAARRVLEDFLRHYLPARRAAPDARPVLPAVPRRDRRRRAVQRRRRRQPHDLLDDGRARHLDHHAHHDAAVPRPAPASGSSAAARSPLALGPRPTPGRARQPGLAPTW